MKSYIYSLNKKDEVVYIGITGNPSKRATTHKLNSRGLTMKIIEEFEDITKRDLLKREDFWINEMGRKGYRLLNKKDNTKDRMEQNEDCPNCGKPIFNVNFRYVGDIREHIDCSKAVIKPIVVYVPDGMALQVKEMAKKEKRSVSQICHLLIKLAMENNVFDNWKKNSQLNKS